MDLILAEKPSVAKLIAKTVGAANKQNGYIEGNNFIITWAYGHLLTLYDAKEYDPIYEKWDLNTLPFIPQQFKYKPVPAMPKARGNSPKVQLDLIKKLVNKPEVDRVIIATDYDREGQVIADSILQYIGNSKPEYRMLLNEWTDQAIQLELQQLTPNSNMKALSEAGFCRQHTDWLFGINWTVAATVALNQNNLFNVGRVILPTLKILYDRKIEQEEFEPMDYYRLSAKSPEGDEFFYEEDEDRDFGDRSMLDDALREVKGGSLEIIDVIDEVKEVYAPTLYNLTHLQADVISSCKGWTAKKVLDICQSLYEKQAITYPRTESTYLDENTLGKTKGVFNTFKAALKDELFYNDLQFKGGKTIFNSAKVHAHGAIIPTYKVPSAVSEDEQFIYSKILNRFLAKFLPPAKYQSVRITCRCDKGVLVCRKSTLLELGWKVLYESSQTFKASQVSYVVGDKIHFERPKVHTLTTEEPAPYTEASLLKVMETCGKNNINTAKVLAGYSIGTSATRAEVINKLKKTMLVSALGKTLEITDKGKYLIEHFPLRELLDLDFTGSMELKLSQIVEGKQSAAQVTAEFEQLVRDGVSYLKQAKGRKCIGKCPLCGLPVIDGPTGYGCLGYINGCKFMFSKKQTERKARRKLQDGDYSLLLEGRSIFYTDAHNGDSYELVLEVNKSNPSFDFTLYKLDV